MMYMLVYQSALQERSTFILLPFPTPSPIFLALSSNSFLLCLLLCFVLYSLSPVFSLFLTSYSSVPFTCFLLIRAYSFLLLLPIPFPPTPASILPLFLSIFPGFAHNTQHFHVHKHHGC